MRTTNTGTPAAPRPVSRRAFLRLAGTAAAVALLPGCGGGGGGSSSPTTPTTPTTPSTGTLTLRSGQADATGRDVAVMVQGSATVSPYGSSGTPQEQASVVTPNPNWVAPAAGSAWISSHADTYGGSGTDEYFVPFTLPASVSSAHLNLQWAADDAGYLLVNGAFVRDPQGSLYTAALYEVRTVSVDITALVRGGANRLSLGVANNGSLPQPNPTGLDFLATITYQY